MKEKFKNQVTLSKKTFKAKATDKETRSLQFKSNSEVIEVTPESLYELVTKENGHAFHPAIFDMENIEPFRYDRKKNPLQLDRAKLATFSDASALYQNVFAVDIDHSDFSIQQVYEQCIVKPTMIYSTFSSKKGQRRYRAVFFATKNVKKEDIRAINKILMLNFCKDLKTHQLECVDSSCVNPARLFYNGTVGELYPENRFDPSTLLRNKLLVDEAERIYKKTHKACQAKKTRTTAVTQASKKTQDSKKSLISEKEKERYIKNCEKQFDNEKLWKWNLELQAKILERKLEAKKQNKAEKKGSKTIGDDDKEKLVVTYNGGTGEVIECSNDPRAVLDLIVSNARKFVTKDEMEYLEFVNFITYLPLNELLNVELNSSFNCYLHDDSNPSASIFFNEENGQTVYKCHANCCDEMNTQAFIMQLQKQLDPTQHFAERLDDLADELGVCINNKFQEMLRKMISNNKIALRRYKKDSSFQKVMSRNNLILLYSAICDFAEELAPRHSYKKSNDGPVIFASLAEIQEFAVSINVGGIKNLSRFDSKINFIAYLGLLKKVNHDDLLDSYKKTAEKVRDSLKVATGDEFILMKNFYEFTPLTPATLEEAERRLNKYLDAGGLISKFSGRVLQGLVGEKQAKEIFTQTKVSLPSSQQQYYNLAIKAAKDLLDNQSYISKDTLPSHVDKKGYIYKADRVALLDENRSTILDENGKIRTKISVSALDKKKKLNEKTFVHITTTLGLRPLSVNASIREQYNLNKKFKEKTIYVLIQ